MNNPRPVCPNGHTPDHFIVPFPVGATADHELIMSDPGALHPDGGVCCSYWDGTYGVTAEDREMIAEAESVFCPVCMSEANWIHDAKGEAQGV